MAKRAIIKFQKTDFQTNLFDKSFMQDLFDDLPDDSVLVSILENFGSSKVYLIVESQSFIDTAPTDPFPEITYTKVSGSVTNSCGGEVVLDLSKAMAPKVASTPPTPCGCGTCFTCISNAWLKYAPANIYAPRTLKIPEGYNTTVKMDMGCSHSWKSYQGLNETFDYCVTCNVKKS